MKTKKEATVKAGQEATTNYGQPVYLTLNGRDKTAEEISLIVNNAIEESAEYGSVLYATVNGGQPVPPPCPPGGCSNG